MNKSNAESLIAFAQTHTTRETDFEVARLNPRAAAPDKIKALDQDLVSISFTGTRKTLKNLERVKSLRGTVQNQEAIDAALELYLKHHDPVLKAARSKNSVRTESSPGRRYISAPLRHHVNFRDEGRCTHTDDRGARCNSDRWAEIHHKVPLSLGGSNNPDNLVTLCSFHHSLEHPDRGRFS